MKQKKTLDQLSSIYGLKILRLLKSKDFTFSEMYHIIEQLYIAMQYQKWREHFHEHPKEIFDF